MTKETFRSSSFERTNEIAPGLKTKGISPLGEISTEEIISKDRKSEGAASMMKMNELEKKVLERVHQHQWTLDPYKDLAKLSEEVGELSREIRRIEDGRERPDEQTPEKEFIRKEIASELGDIMFPLVKIAHYYGITLEEAFQAHQEKMDKRYN